MLWAGAPLSAAAVWLPWLFYLTDGAMRKPRSLYGVGLALATAASLVSGHAETAGAGASGGRTVFSVARVRVVFFEKDSADCGYCARPARLSSDGYSASALSAPQTWPTIEYLQTSHRIATRSGSETPSVGLIALPQLFLPEFNGTTRRGSSYIGGTGNLLESSSAGYVGLITALVLAPLALANRRQRPIAIFAAILAILGMGQILGLPLLKQI